MANLLNSIILKCEENANINIMTYQNRFISPQGGPVRLFGLPWGFTPNRCLSPQKNIFVIAHPLPPKNRPSTSQKIDFFEKKFEKILKVQKFLGSKCCRYLCHEGRTPHDHNFSVFQSWRIPRKTRKVTII